MEWDGWKATVLPELVKYVSLCTPRSDAVLMRMLLIRLRRYFPSALASPGQSSDIALTTLAYLVENNRLDIKAASIGSEWWDSIAEWVKETLRNWRCNEQNASFFQQSHNHLC